MAKETTRPASMTRYRLTEEGFAALKQRMTRRGLITGGVTALIAAVLFSFLQISSRSLSTPVLIGLFVIVFGLFFAVTYLGTQRSIKRLAEFWDTFELRLGEEKLSLRHIGAKKVTIRREDVLRIGETPDEGLWVSTGLEEEDGLTVHIPQEVEDYPQVREVLSTWAEVEEVPSQAAPRVPGWAWLALFLIAYGVVLLVNSLWIVLPVGILLIGFSVYIGIAILRNPNFETPVKLGTVLLALLILSVIGRIGFLVAAP
ncbi:MAG: hypothetical protein GYB64_04060 [Chloroflexi bacterium]|nr:hypothetical protein [Chloroflexota bacterium]